MAGQEAETVEGEAGSVGAAGGSVLLSPAFFVRSQGPSPGATVAPALEALARSEAAGQMPQAARTGECGSDGLESIPGRMRITMGAGDTVFIEAVDFLQMREDAA